jgi:hypothetical protein
VHPTVQGQRGDQHDVVDAGVGRRGAVKIAFGFDR